MKRIFIFLLTAITLHAAAQIPAGYYDSATGTGYTLKTQLYNIIKGHTDLGYDGLYTTYQTSDRDYYYENDGSVLDMYSENPNGADPYNFSAGPSQRCGNYSHEGDCYNREHTIPQSVFNEAAPMHNDAHFIVPTDGKVNGIRSNYPYGTVGSATYTSENGSKLGNASNTGYSAGYSGIVFEPIDEFKGDIARMYFYFATRYQNVVAGYSYAMFNGTSNQVFNNTFLEILKHWAAQDPVSQREIDRNNAIYARQGNRNPYIDHPEWVQAVWGAMLATPAFDIESVLTVSPNPAQNHAIGLRVSQPVDNIQVVNTNGQIVRDVKDRPAGDVVIDGMVSGFYFVKVTVGGSQAVKKVVLH